MREVIVTNLGSSGLLIPGAIIIFILFIVLRFFRALFSASFIGFILSLVSYFVYDYIYMSFPLVACLAFILCLTGFSKAGIIRKILALIGLILSGYIIIYTLGLI
jgi:hypothetical protein